MEKNIPKRRFKEFIGSGEWEEKKLGDILKYEQPTNYIVNTTDYSESYSTPVLTAGQSFILGYTNEEKGIKKASDENPIIIFDDFTTSSHYVDFSFKVKSSAMKLLYLQDNNYNFYFIYNSLKNIDYKPQSHERHWISKFSNFIVKIPSLPEQEKIGNFFEKLDRLIDLNREKLEKLKNSKSAYLSEMFPKEGELYPKRRFVGFTEPWEEKKFGDIFEVSQGLQIAINKRFTTPGKNRFFYITNEFLKDGSKNKYYVYNPPKNVVCAKNDILMTRTGNTGIIVTNVEGCFHNNFFKIKYDYFYLDKDFICELLSSPNMKKKILNSAGNSTIPDLSHKSFYNLSDKFPSLEEQEEIGNFFKKLDERIILQEEKIEKLENMKRAYLSEMFV